MALMLSGCVSTGVNLGGGDGAQPPVGALHPDRPDDVVSGRVISISDGDTLDMDTADGTVEVRLVGVNAAERNECFSEEPRQYLTDELMGAEVGVGSVGIDQFGRTLANLWLNDELVNLNLVLMGLAVAAVPDETNEYGQLMIDGEEIAFQDSTGLWSPDACGASGERPAVRFDLDSSVFDPEGPDDLNIDQELIVIVNDEDTDVAMGGWTLRDNSSRNRLIFSNLTLLPGERLEISSGCATDPGWCADTPIWNNNGDLAMLLDATGRVVARARY